MCCALLVGRFAQWLFTHAPLRVDYFVELVVLVLRRSFVFSRHSLVARSDKLSCVLFPGIERLLLLVERKVLVADYIDGLGVSLRRTFDSAGFAWSTVDHDLLAQ